MQLALTTTAAFAVLALAGCASTSVETTPDPASTPTTVVSTTTTAVPGTTPATTSAPSTTAPIDLVAAGKTLAGRNGCAACHSTDGSARVGPTWQGLLGRTELLTSGASVVVDEGYLRRSIIDPDSEIVSGFPPGVMPADFGDKLAGDDIAALIEYIKSL